jgi:acyl-CoA hydrolase
LSKPERYTDADECAEQLIHRLSGRVALALPLGIGKAVRLTDALYCKAKAHPEIELSIHSALSLELPRAGSELERRFLEPLVARLYEGVPVPEYIADLRRGALPGNVQIEDFYFRPGAFLGVQQAQQHYLSINYTSVAAAVLDRGVNVIAQGVAPGEVPEQLSLSGNPDTTLDLLDAARTRGIPLLTVGEINPQLPFMPRDAAVPASGFDMLLDTGSEGYPLFPVPNRAASLTDYAIALRIAGLVKDGGTLQIGIGSLGDGIAYSIGLRRTQNERYRQLLNALAPHDLAPELDDLPRGLYGSSEMFVEGFLYLRDLDVLTRTVADNVYLHAGFFLGSARFYERLRQLSDEERQGINMTRISFTNSLLNDTAAKRSQRRDARFINSAMMVTLMGAVVSDGLADGRVVSGVGGQYNFVAMAHELEGARSIIAVPATRVVRGKTSSNIVWSYAHTTIPRHLRDMVVTEYGVADLKNATDQEVIAALLNVADSRFQEALRAEAVSAGKLPESHQIPERHRNNYPETIDQAFAESGALEAMPFYPLGTDLTETEAALAEALSMLAALRGDTLALLRMARRGRSAAADPELQAGLSRMGLAQAQGIKERFYQALVAAALAEVRDTGRPLFSSQ